MKRTITLAAGESRGVNLSGRYVYVEQASADIELTLINQDGVNDVDVYQARSGAEVNGRLARVEVKNLGGGSNTITLRSGWVRYIPPINTSGSTVEVEPGSAPLDVVGTVQVEPGAAPLDVTGSTVTVEPGVAPLDVTGSVVEVAGSVICNTPAPITPTVSGSVIPANAARRGVYVFTPATNLLPIELASVAGNGIPMAPNTFFPCLIETTAAIPVIAGNGTDVINYIEV